MAFLVIYFFFTGNKPSAQAPEASLFLG